MRKRYLGVYSHGKFNFMDEKEALCTEHRAYCDVCVKNNVLMVDMTVWESPFCHPEFISGSIQCGSLQFNAYKMLLEFLPRSQSFGKGTLFQEPQSVRYPALMPCRNSLKQVQHDDGGCKTGLPRHCVARNDGDVTTRFFRLRPLNDGRTMHNDQNGLTVMSSRSSINEKSKVKPETKCNQIQNKLWQKQSNRNISTCVAQREVA